MLFYATNNTNIFANEKHWTRWAKAGADLGATIFTDINILDGEVVGEVVGAELAEKGVADVAEDVGKDAVSACGGGLSFIATTKVATQVGEQAIGTLKVGEKVWAYNPSTKKMELQPILHVWINHDNDLVDLTITHTTKQGKATKPVSEVIHTNKKHPFLTVEKGFLPVGQIKLGMHVVEADGQAGVITGRKVVPGIKTMYNLEVAQDHTFVVGMGMWVVHNCAAPAPNKISSLIGSDNRLIKAAQKAGKDQAVQRDIDNMTQRLLAGGDAGMEQGSLSNGISYLRSRNGARVFYRVSDNTYEILGKASKANEQTVINTVQELFGG